MERYHQEFTLIIRDFRLLLKMILTTLELS